MSYNPNEDLDDELKGLPKPYSKEHDVDFACAKQLDEEEEGGGDTASRPDCPVCLQPSIHPVKLPCKHIFCFLCVKGAASRSRRCALCRQEIPTDFFTCPNLVYREDLQHTLKFDDNYQWYYEGQNGWWQYDDRTSTELEQHHKNGDTVFDLLIAGYIYSIDFNNMVQCRRNDRTRKRHIKRDLVNIPGKKGVAGLLFTSPQVDSDAERPIGDGGECSGVQGMVAISAQQTDRTVGYSDALTPPAPYNTPRTPQTPAESPPSTGASEQDLSAWLQRLAIGVGSASDAAGNSLEFYNLEDHASSSHHSSVGSLAVEELVGNQSEIYQQIQEEIAAEESDSGTHDETLGIQV